MGRRRCSRQRRSALAATLCGALIAAFGSAAAQVRAWTKLAGSASWMSAGPVLPAGFGSSYDAAAAAVPGGPLLVVAGVAPPGQACIAGGSVAIANLSGRGRLGPVRLISDQRGTGRFDDRPTVAAGPGGTVWAAWSQGPDSDACQNVGAGDRIEVAVSHDGGRRFGPPVEMPAGGGSSAFGVRLAPLGGNRVAVSWTEVTGPGDQAVLVSVISPAGQVSPPQQVLTGDALPLVLPGASFYDFPAGDIAALPDGRLVVAAPFWSSDRSVIDVAAGVPGGRWRVSGISPPAGAGLLLPALGFLTPAGVVLVCAVHVRAADRLGYDWTNLRLDGAEVHQAARLARLTPSPAGPGFFELGEELTLSGSPGGLLSAVVVAGRDGAVLQAESWTAPYPAAASASAAASAPAARPGSAPNPARPRAVSRGAARASDPASLWAGAAAAVTITLCLGLLAVRAARRRGTRAASPWQ